MAPQMSHPAMEALPGTSSSSSPISQAPSILPLHVLKYTELLPIWVLAPAFLPGNLFPSAFSRSAALIFIQVSTQMSWFRDTMPDCLSSV